MSGSRTNCCSEAHLGVDTLDGRGMCTLYTLLSDVQRDANTFRTEVADIPLDRIHYDRPVPGQYGSIQRTTRRNRSLKDDEDVLSVLEDAGIDPERVLGGFRGYRDRFGLTRR